MKINIVIVTYNRLAFLQDCIRSVKSQSQPFNKIFIINNGSTDGTGQWLEQQKNESIKVIHQGNTGGSGGFRTGMKAAYDDGADWIWVMDDDVEVKPDCLEKLLSYADYSDCIHPRKYYSDGAEYNWEGYFDIDTANVFELKNVSFRNGKSICYTNLACFEGMLIRRSLIEKIGFPDERFFIVYDDMIYGFLASFHTNIAFVADAVITSKKKSEISPETDFYLYHYIRNRHLVEEYIDTYAPQGNKRTRDILFKLYVLKKLLVFPFRKRKLIKEKFKTMSIVIRAYKDYRDRKVGKTF